MHKEELEKQVKKFKDQQAMVKIMFNDLETYKQKAEMSKQRATYFSPFNPIKTFSQDTLFKQPAKNDII